MCSARGGLLATRNETYPFDSDAWIAGPIKNSSITTGKQDIFQLFKNRIKNSSITTGKQDIFQLFKYRIKIIDISITCTFV